MVGADTHKEYVDFEEKNLSLVLLSAIKQWYEFFLVGESRYLWYIYILTMIVVL